MTTPMTCPRCAAPLLPGPRGGLAQNYYCSNRTSCRSGFNVTIWQGQALAVEEIGLVDDERFSMYARVRQ